MSLPAKTVGRLIRAVLLLVLAVSPLFAAKAPPVWTLVKTPNFTVLTTGKAEEAQTWATDMERLRLALGKMMPLKVERLTPVVVVIFPNDAAFRPYKMLQKGKPAAVAGYFSRSDGVNAISLAIDAEDPVQMKRVIFHEATHWFTSGQAEMLPVWLEEGMAEVFSTFTADERSFAVGDTIKAHVRYLQAKGVPSPKVLLGTAAGSIDYDDTVRTGRLYAGSWLLVHWIIFGKDTPGADSLVRYIQLVKTASDPEAAFTQAFGGDYKTIQKRLEKYIDGGHYTRFRIKLPAEPLGIEPPRRATPAEVEYALGALLLGSQGPQAGLPRLIHSTELEGKNPVSWEAVGFAQLRLGDKAAALTAFNHAVETGSKIGQVWSDRASLQLEANYSGEMMTASDPAEFGQAAADFRQAIALDPYCEHAYDGLSGIVYSVKPEDPADVKRLEAGRQFFPDDVWIKMGLATVQLRSGTPGAAAALQELLAGASLPTPVRRLGENALEQEKLKVIFEHIQSLQDERHYAELVAELDHALTDEGISAQNKQELRRVRDQVDQTQRVQLAVDALNAGRREDAAVMLRKLMQEAPTNGITRRETERLLKIAESTETER